MAKVEWLIAWRYLFSKKGHHAINIISGISAGAIAVVTAAMICVLSVMNGFGKVVEQMFSEFDPDLRIEKVDGKYFHTNTPLFSKLNQTEGIACVSEIVEENALIRYQAHQTPARIMGVDAQFGQLTHIESIITDGKYMLYDGAFDRAVVGRGLAATLGVQAHFVESMHLFAPERIGRINPMRPDKSYREERAFIAGTFAVNQTSYDDQVMLVSIEQARRLFHYDSTMVTQLAIGLDGKKPVEQVQKHLQEQLGSGYRVLNRQEQQADFYHILKIEKLLTAVLLVFILLVACFNCICSLTMLMIDKKKDIGILRAMGANKHQIQGIFRLEGWLISVLGAVIGIVLGVGICLLQQHFGWLKLGDGQEYVLAAYPVWVEAWDVIWVSLAVLGLGLLAAWIPTRKLVVVASLALTIIACQPITPRPKPASELVEAHTKIYGQAYDSIPHQVIDLDLYSAGVGLDSTRHIAGTGTNLYISDIFVDDTVLTVGTYRSDTTGAAFTFLPGQDYDGTPSGIYLLSISNSQIEQIQLMDSGVMVVSEAADGGREIELKMYYGRYTYQAHYQGIIDYVDKRTQP